MCEKNNLPVRLGRVARSQIKMIGATKYEHHQT